MIYCLYLFSCAGFFVKKYENGRPFKDSRGTFTFKTKQCSNHRKWFCYTLLCWAKDFKVWLNDVLTNKSYSPAERKARLLDFKSLPDFTKAHPTMDHFLPLAMTCAAAEYGPGKLIYSEFVRSLLNEHYMFWESPWILTAISNHKHHISPLSLSKFCLARSFLSWLKRIPLFSHLKLSKFGNF